ncbi:MAG TPA: hypothetical protein VGM62_03165 [Chthoniobacterales bacterium]
MLSSESHAWTPRQRAIIVGAVVAGLVALSALVYGYVWSQRDKPMKGVEKIEDLGFGFRRITIAKFDKAELKHYPFLYYRERLLGQLAAPPSISPTGNYAVYQDARTGKLILFRRSDEKITDLTSTFIGLVNSYVWHEDQGNVEAVLGGQAMSAVFSLQ